MQKETSSRGISFMGLLTVLFIGLKLSNIIDWGWGWVLAPIWVGPSILLIIGIIALIIVKIKKW
jgi:hypothetical protein